MLSSSQTENCNLSLINNLGQTVKSTSVTVPSNTAYKTNFDISDLPPGAYLYKVASASGKSNTGKIMITR
jgi:hypothetical protein